jgi:ribonucleoside-diphosphate reductase alpha chain
MRVIKRNGSQQQMNFEKILYRLTRLKEKEPRLDYISCDELAQLVISNIYDLISTTEIDEISARLSIERSSIHPDYKDLAGRISISNRQKNCPRKFSEAIFSVKHLINDTLLETVKKFKNEIDSAIIDENDYLFDFFGLKTLERSYLLKKIDENGKATIVETPQYLLMRVALGLHNTEPKNDIKDALKTYKLCSELYFTHASPTLFNAGTKTPLCSKGQLSSCFLMQVEDSLEGIMKSLTDCALISKFAGGLGVNVSDIRGKNSLIKGTNGLTDNSGIIPMLKIFNDLGRWVNQGGKRNGSIAVYLEPTSPDIFEFLEIRNNTGDENLRTKDLFSALWVSDYFMECVEKDLDWHTFSSDVCPDLTEKFGDDYVKLVNKYIKEGKYKEKFKARDLWSKIIVSNIETGMPYILYKDSVNRKNNQENLGTIKNSNLCAEVMLYSSTKDKEIAVCNIATVSLKKFVEVDQETKKKFFNHKKLGEVVGVMVENLNKVIDINYYPVPETEKSNLSHRPIIVGAQGLANTFFELGLAFESDEARELNKKIYETIQYHSLKRSMELAKEHGPYCSFIGSPSSKGIFQHNMWGVDNKDLTYDWDDLSKDVRKYGLRNSLVTGSPPTASTSQILGNYESFEPVTNNFFTRETLSGNYPVINMYLVRDLINLGLWNDSMKNRIISKKGSVQSIEEIPENIKKIYKTVWEISQKKLIDLSRDRGLFTDHSQSLNIFMTNPSIAKISSMHFYGWKSGLKTGMYYLRTRAVANAQQFTVSKEDREYKKTEEDQLYCSLENPGSCEMCSG